MVAEPDDYDEADYDDDDDPYCTWCDGEPWAQECPNPLE